MLVFSKDVFTSIIYSIYELLNNKTHDLDWGEVNKFLNEFDKLLSIIDRYFGDFVYNIIVNMKQVVEFNQKINNKIIDKERLYWYNLLLNFDSHFIIDQIKIYQSISKEIYVWLYEDFRKCQNYAYDLFNQSVTNFNKSKKRFENGINIYELNGEDFIIPVHATAFSKNDNNFIWNEGGSTRTLSLSLIGHKCLGTYRNPKEYLVFGFDKLNINDIIHMYHADSYSR